MATLTDFKNWTAGGGTADQFATYFPDFDMNADWGGGSANTWLNSQNQSGNTGGANGNYQPPSNSTGGGNSYDFGNRSASDPSVPVFGSGSITSTVGDPNASSGLSQSASSMLGAGVGAGGRNQGRVPGLGPPPTSDTPTPALPPPPATSNVPPRVPRPGTSMDPYGNIAPPPSSTAAYSASQPNPSATTPPPAATGNANPYTANPYAANPGYNGPTGSGTYNPQTFATQDYANYIAQQYGGTVVSDAASGMLSGAGSPFSTNQPQYMVRLANGTTIDPAGIARIYSAAQGQQGGLTSYQQALVQDILNGSNGVALNQPGFNGVNQAFPTGTPAQPASGVGINTGGYTPSPTIAAQWALQGGPTQPGPQATSTDLTNNPFNVGTQYPTNSPYGGNTNGQGPDSTNPDQQASQGAGNANTGTPGAGQGFDWSNLNAQTLPLALQMLQAYAGMGSGGGNPTAVNNNGQLGQMLQYLLSGMSGNQDLYSRRRQYPQFA